ncbi:ATP-binding cassette domain-containing protein [Microbacterium hibisci]|uniref:ATP-binding cassette domain-containing protein n=1 Tax=Microbacterium hibisci TaxID=2036000 RepID=UPI00194180CB|nr:ATP-binding cassette domain-containing protein [Microbacterium hibisci]
MTFRPGPLRAAAILAAGFVAARVVYRALFHGADGDGPVLLDLPAVRLPAPFAHVVLLGPVTTDGLTDAAASALPIALTILAFGVANALVDLHRVFARTSRRGPLRGIARALAIAWATLPSLAEGARAVRFAQRLRGERGGARMLLPLLERTLERAGNVAAALELRGFAGRGLDGDCLAPVEARDVSIGHGRRPGGAAADAALAAGADDQAVGRLSLPPSLTLAAGTLTLVAGPTGSGKSTLLRGVSGLHSHADGGWIAGILRVVGHERAAVPPRDLARRVGVVLQHPREAFATERVRDEIGLALELRGVAPVIVADRVAEVAKRVGVIGLLDRPTRGLSAGEATLVAIAAAIVEHPILLLVDEPLADLDAAARVRIARLLDALAHEAGMCVVVAEHRVEALAAVADSVLRLDDGAVAVVEPGSLPASRSAAQPRGRPCAPGWPGTRSEPDDATTGLGRRGAGRSSDVVLTARGITVAHGDTVAVAGVDLELAAGEVVALTGANGAGKSSLLAALALPARSADVTAAGRVALVPDASDDLFTSDTVAAECRRADRRAARAGRAPRSGGGLPEEIRRTADPRGRSAPLLRRSPRIGRPEGSAATARVLAGFLGLDPDGPAFAARLARHPRDLSAGERRCLAIAIQLAGAPRALLVDEPTRGLDPAARELVWAALASLADAGTAVLIASHEPAFTGRADRELAMRSGSLAPVHPPKPGGVPAHTSAPPTTSALGIPSAHAATAARPRESAAPNAAVAAQTGSRTPPPRRRPGLGSLALAAANLVALGAFCWPLVATAVPEQAHAAVPVAAFALIPLAALVVVATLDGTVRSAHLLALLGTLAAIGAAVRIAGTGVGGVEAVFILLILAGRAYGARFGMLLGMATIALSTVVTGTFGPWTPFQMFACAWVGAVAGVLPRRMSRLGEIAMLCTYGVVASYLFGLLMNLWYWPFAVGYGTGISYDGGAPFGVNLSSFVVYSLVTSTLSWDTLRAITTVIGLVVVGRPILAALRRTKPLTSPAPAPAAVARQPAHAVQ